MEYKDRRTGLILFGILEILLGLLTALMALLVLVGAVAGAGAPQAAPMRMMVPAAIIYVLVAAIFIVLGVGSMMARRWARALLLVLSWWWLIIGVMSCAVMVIVAPLMFETLPADQAEVRPIVIGCMSVFFGIFFLLLPLLFVLFYRSPNVKATVEARDPVHRWTDDVPMPLLVFAVWMLGGAGAMLLCTFMYRSFPLGPWMLRGAIVPVIVLGFAALMAFIGFGALRRMRAAWWAAVVLLVAGVGWGAAFLAGKADFVAWYRDMGVPVDPRQIDLMRTMYSSPWFLAWMGIFWIGYAGYLIYLRRYFFPREGSSDMRPLTAAVLLLLLAPPARAQTPCNEQKTIVVTGNGSARIAPDRVSFTVGVVTTSPSVSQAFHDNNEKNGRVVRALKSRGVQDAEIQTSNFTIDAPWDPQTQTKSTKMYMVINSVTVTRSDPKAVSDLIQTAIDAGANSASNLLFFNSSPTVARDRAIELAIRDARAQAEKIAAGVGRSVGDALAVTTMPVYQPVTAVTEAITVTANAPTIESGSTQVSYSVSITYELK